MRLRHYSIFNELEESKINWDYLRENNKEPLYYMPNNINDYNTIASTHNNNLLIKHTLKYVKKPAIMLTIFCIKQPSDQCLEVSKILLQQIKVIFQVF